MKKLNRKSASPPLLRRPAPAQYFHPLFNCSGFPSRGGNQNFLPAPFKIGGGDPNYDISVKIIKVNYDAFPEFIIHNFNEGICTYLKSAKVKPKVKPVFKKRYRIDNKNNKPVSILPKLSKAFGKLIFPQLIMVFEPVFYIY